MRTCHSDQLFASRGAEKTVRLVTSWLLAGINSEGLGDLALKIKINQLEKYPRLQVTRKTFKNPLQPSTVQQ